MVFCKMQGAGNDFIIFNNIKQEIPQEKFPEMAKRLCTRKLSIGADGLMVVEPPERGGDIKVRLINADGTDAEMCGNGVRCMGRYVYEEGIAGERITIEAAAGDVAVERLSKRSYKIKLQRAAVIKEGRTVEVSGKKYEYTYIELGNPGIPHIVVEMPGLKDLDKEDLRVLGRQLRYHPDFPKGANVNFYQALDSNSVVLLTYERGVEDFTLACGTGSGSTALSLKLRGKLQGDSLKLNVPGGLLVVDLKQADGGEYDLYLTGDTNIIAKGEILDEDLGSY
ncbi:diaminopimelate epimerase [Spirochaetia bacterium]|nr:diaminopimelate epimerase [Spirochaetia bacterium]